MAQPMLVLAVCLSVRGGEDQSILDHACFFMREGMATVNWPVRGNGAKQ